MKEIMTIEQAYNEAQVQLTTGEHNATQHGELTQRKDLKQLTQNQKRYLTRYKTFEGLAIKFLPQYQILFAEQPIKSLVGDCPSLKDVKDIWGETNVAIWLANQIHDLSEYTGVNKKLNDYQKEEIARLITSEFHFLKLSELMLFFFKFKVGMYGSFYGAIDPLVITGALQKFNNWRCGMLKQIEQAEVLIKDSKEKPSCNPDCITYEEWQELKWLFNMGYERDAVTGKIK